jgi:hypothetical protein
MEAAQPANSSVADRAAIRRQIFMWTLLAYVVKRSPSIKSKHAWRGFAMAQMAPRTLRFARAAIEEAQSVSPCLPQ